MRKSLRTYLSGFLTGKESIDKTVMVVMRLWFQAPAGEKELLSRALALIEELSAEERLWVYWGLIMLRYPFFRSVAAITGRLIDLQGSVKIQEIEHRIVEKWGDRSTVRRVAMP